MIPTDGIKNAPFSGRLSCLYIVTLQLEENAAPMVTPSEEPNCSVMLISCTSEAASSVVPLNSILLVISRPGAEHAALNASVTVCMAHLSMKFMDISPHNHVPSASGRKMGAERSPT